jgi:lipopolysaccharide/colanic/teichoic acid biosynthesis glycosyltransferase
LGHDLQYLMAWSPILDLQILAATLLVMLRREP